jgi:TolA-binding protein
MKKTFGMLIACLCLAVTVQAQEPEKEAVSVWEMIRSKIEKITPKQKPTVTTAVGGVRGAKTEGQELYWKGEEAPLAISAEEIEQFSAALQLAESGATAEATTSFQNFVATYPDSPLLEEANNALLELAKAPAPAPASNEPGQAPQPEGFAPPAELPGFKLGM